MGDKTSYTNKTILLIKLSYHLQLLHIISIHLAITNTPASFCLPAICLVLWNSSSNLDNQIETLSLPHSNN